MERGFGQPRDVKTAWDITPARSGLDTSRCRRSPSVIGPIGLHNAIASVQACDLVRETNSSPGDTRLLFRDSALDALNYRNRASPFWRR